MLPDLIMWSAAAAAALWRLTQFARAPRDRGTAVIAAATVLVFVALSAPLAATVPALSPLVPGRSEKLLQNLLLICFFALAIGILRSMGAPAVGRAFPLAQLGLAVLVDLVLLAVFLGTPAELRGRTYESADGHPDLLAFYMIANTYLAYANACCAVLALRASRQANRRVRPSLRIVAAGLGLACLGGHLPRALTSAGKLFMDREPLPATELWTEPLIAFAIVIIFIGMSFPGVWVSMVTARIWFEAHRDHRRLRPLWLALHGRFPDIALHGPTGPLRELVDVRHVRLRYHRRVIECRDGLVRLSPYLPVPVDAGQSPLEQARVITEALTRVGGSDAVSPVSTIAAPPVSAGNEAVGIDADARQLLLLSRALREDPGTELTTGPGRTHARAGQVGNG